MARRLGIDLQKVADLDFQIQKLKSIKDPEEQLRVTEELVRKYPKHPKSHLELARCLYKFCDPNQFEQMDRYGEVWQEWLVQTGLAELDMEFVWVGIVVGSLGNHFLIESLLKANQSGLRRARKPFLLLPRNAQLRNPALFEYFEPHLNVVRDEEAIQALKSLESLLTLPLGWVTPMNDMIGCTSLDLAANRIEV